MDQKSRIELDQIIARIAHQRNAMLEELNSSPPGELQGSEDRGRPQYYQVIKGGGLYNRHGINRNRSIIRALARKRYLQESVSLLGRNLDLLVTASNATVSFAPDQIVDRLNHSLPPLPIDYYLCSEDINPSDAYPPELREHLKTCQKWATAPYEQSRYKPQGRKITTTRSVRVRSKSEALIANLLHDNGIPFRYEQVVYLGETIIVPDFTFLSRSGREIYWEHAGMMNDPKYSLRHHHKMLQYESAGIFPWQNLIVTYDTGNEINMPMIESVLENILLPAL